MKLILYSGGTPGENRALDRELLTLAKKKSPTITFIPASSYEAEIEFRDFIQHYKRYSVAKFMLLPVDIPMDKTMIDLALKSDIIYLGGGNTFYFLNSLRKSGMMARLKKYVMGGGVLSGLSAGAIMMTPTIETAGYPDFDRDDNYVHLSNLDSLSLIDYDFFPHYKNTRRYEKSFIKFTKHRTRPLFACPDGTGLVFDEAGPKIIGKVTVYFRGQKFIL